MKISEQLQNPDGKQNDWDNYKNIEFYSDL